MIKVIELDLYKKHRNILLIAFAAFISVIYVIFSFYFTSDYPVNIDDVIICISDLMLAVDGDISYFEYLFKRKNENPTIILRLINLINFGITGQINFATIPIVSNILIAFFAFYLARKYKELRFSFFIPLLLLIPTAQYIYWSSAAASYMFTAIFLFFSLNIIKDAKSFKEIPLLFTLITLLTYSFANGFLGCILIVFYCVYMMFFSSLKKTLGFSIITISFIHLAIFLFGYEGGNFRINLGVNKILFIFAFCGNIFKYLSDVWLIVGSIATLIIFYLLSLFVKNFRDNSAMILFFMVGFVFASAIIVALSRCRSLTLCNPFFIRYEIFGVIFITFGLIAILKLGSKFFIYPLLCLMVLTLSIKTIDNFNFLRNDKFENDRKKVVGYFKQNYNFKAFNKRFIDKGKVDYQEAISRNYISNVKPELGISDRIENLDITENDLLEIKFRKTIELENFMLVRGRFIDRQPSNVYIQIDDVYYKLKAYSRPSNSKNSDSEFYTILPKMKSKGYKIIAI